MPTLQWVTRDLDVKRADAVPYRLLEPVAELGGGNPAAGNMLVQGDNLDALKALLPYYAGQVKCIYIDPPYNTRSAFEHYDDNLEHSQWLAMIYPRLVLLRELLSEDGSIWVSIDDNEAHYLKAVMDEIFGRSNFLTSFIWKKSYGGGAKAKWFVGLHEHILCYAKRLEAFPPMFLPPDASAAARYYKYRDDKFAERGPFRLQPLATTSNDERPNLRFPIALADGREVWPEKQWQWSKERVEKAQQADEIVISERGAKMTVSYKQYLRDPEGNERQRKPQTIFEGPFTQQGSYESMALFGLAEKFAFPKPEGLIQTILEAASEPGDLVLDSFLGSGTTAAVAHKMGRRWIGIEMGDHAVTHCVPRLRKVIEGEQGGVSEAVGWIGGGGFTFYRLGETVFDETGALRPGIPFHHLAAHVWFSEAGNALEREPVGPFLGSDGERGVALLYNGVLGDKRPDGGNVLTSATLRIVREAAGGLAGPLTIYGEASRLGPERLRAEGVTFKQTPYDVRTR